MDNDNKKKNTHTHTIYVQTNVMNMYAKFQLHLPYGFRGEDFLIIFRKFTLYVAMATIQIQLRSGLFVCVEVLRPSQQLRSCRAGQLPINIVPGQAGPPSSFAGLTYYLFVLNIKI